MKILYLPCHSVHEFDEVRMFHDLGYEIFSPGAYFNPQTTEFLRPGITGLKYDEKIVNEYHQIGGMHPGKDAKDHLTKEFVDNFDVVIIMSLSRWVIDNWDAIKHKHVILRTNGQGDKTYEEFITKYRKNSNFHVIRYSPAEKYFPSYGGHDAIIRFGKRFDEYPDYVGSKLVLSTLVQSMKGRQSACNWATFKLLSAEVDCMLYGGGNEDADLLWYGKKTTFEETFNLLKQHRAYFYAGTKPANYTLNFIEALIVGLPMVCVGEKLGNKEGYKTYEIPYLLNESNGIVSDDINELIDYTKYLFENENKALEISLNNKNLAKKLFNEEDIKLQWKEYLDDNINY